MREKVLTNREKTTLNRASYMKRAAGVIEGFLSVRFSALSAVVAIAQQYDEALTYDDVFKFWNFKNMNLDVLERMEKVLEKLKAE